MVKETILTPDLIKRTREALERLYTGVCTIEVRKRAKNEETKKQEYIEEVIYENVPCRLSHSSNDPSNSRPLPIAEQVITLFLAPAAEIEVPDGSRITVTQDEITDVFGHSGKPNNFPTHQEITLTTWEGWNGQKRNSGD